MASSVPSNRAAARKARIRRRRGVALGVVALVILLVAFGVVYPRIISRSEAPANTNTAATAPPETTPVTTTTASASTATTPPPKPVRRAADTTSLRLINTIGGDISPKSVVSSGTGYITAQNMMYNHTVTVYDAKSMRLIKTIRDSVTLAKFGYKGHPGSSQGAPVEAAFSPDATYAYVTNYSMYGAGFGPEGSDTCTPESGYDRSFTYRIKTGSWKIDQVYEVGSVPKVVQATADGKYVLVSNWCSWDLSVISTAKGRVVRTIPIGAYPRGIAISPKSNAAYVAVMGGSSLVRVDLTSWKIRSISIGQGPRAIVFDPSYRYIYATLNAEGMVAKLDLRTGNVDQVSTGQAPRSLTVSSDGKAIYVVNYESASISKVRTRDMKVLQTIDACEHPIGIAYDAPTARVWAACYGGALLVFNDK